MNKILASKWTKVFLFLLCLAPMYYLFWRGYNTAHLRQPDFTANPVEGTSRTLPATGRCASC